MSIFSQAENAIFGSPKDPQNNPSMQGVADLFKSVRLTRDTLLGVDGLASVTSSDLDVGEYARVMANGATYQRAADTATDDDLDYSGGGGVKWYVVPHLGAVSLAAYGVDAAFAADIGPLVQKAISRLPEGGSVLFDAGTFLWDTPVTTSNHGVHLVGVAPSSLRAISGQDGPQTRITTSSDDGRALMTWSGTDSENFVFGGGAANILFDPLSELNATPFKMEYVAGASFRNVNIRNVDGNALYLLRVQDSMFDFCCFTKSGSASRTAPVVVLDTEDDGIYEDGCNMIRFRSCRWESNAWTSIQAANSGSTSRTNGLIYFEGCKFHGIGDLPVASQPAVPAIDWVAGSTVTVHGSYFYLFNGHFIDVHAGSVQAYGNKFTTNDISAAIRMRSGVTGSVVGPNEYNSNSKVAAQDDITDDNVIFEPVKGFFRLSGGLFIYDDGGRFAFGNNLFRDGSSYYQINGAAPSYVMRASSSDSEGVTVQRAAAGGVDGGTVTPAGLVKISLDEGLQFNGLAVANIGGSVVTGDYGSQFTDISSNINTVGKVEGSQRLDRSNGRLVLASGPSAGDVWTDVNGTTVYTPV